MSSAVFARSVPLIVILSVYFAVTSVHSEQRFLEPPPLHQEVTADQDVRLVCRIQNKRGRCVWMKDQKLLVVQPDQRQEVARTEKYQIISNDNDDDCTLLIKKASLGADDGNWVCLVQSSGEAFNDALTSLPSRLLVIAEPRPPLLTYEGGKPLEKILSLKDGQDVRIACTSNYGNPPAFIKWFIGNNEVEPLIEQKNISEVEKPKTWKAYSLFHLHGQKKYHGLPIRCVAFHPSSLSQASMEAQLNIQYSPEARIETNPRPLRDAPEDTESFFGLKCLAEGNPLADIKWFKNSIPLDESTMLRLKHSKIFSSNGSLQISELRFDPVQRLDTGMYSCKAVNMIGESTFASYSLDVQYKPRIRHEEGANDTSVESVETVQLGSTVELFECPEFEANPSPQYRWLHPLRRVTAFATSNGQTYSANKRLRLERVTWSDQGEYRCFAFNAINGEKKEVYSKRRYKVIVMGPPEIVVKPSTDHTGGHESIGWIGERVHRLKVRLCSYPPPREVTWEWGSNQIRAGDHIHPKYEALPLEPIVEHGVVTNCFLAKLEIKNLQKEDARMYTLSVQSEKGEDTTSIKLTLKDSTETRLIGATVIIGVVLMLTLLSVGIWSLVRFRRKRTYHEAEEGSISADALYNNGTSTDSRKPINPSTHTKTFARKPNLDNDQSTYDYSQVVKTQARTISPEALKVRRAPVVLQAPTIV